MKKTVYNPGCALLLYKEHIADNVLSYLNKNQNIDLHTICCHHQPQLPQGSLIINTCAGCDRRFTNNYDTVETITLWEILAQSNDFDFPDHSGLKVSIHDACPIRTKPQVHEAIRVLLNKMNIEVIENEHTKDKSICCGDSYYPEVDLDTIHNSMKQRAQSMPCDDVVVYCVSCIKAMYIGGKRPRYILDLLFNEDTEIQVYDTKEWHDQINAFIATH